MIGSLLSVSTPTCTALLSQKEVCERGAYERNKTYRKRIASVIATGNSKQFLTDQTGNRRWMPFEVIMIDNPLNAEIDYKGVMGQAQALLDQGFQYWIDSNDVEQSKDHVSQFEVTRLEHELVFTHFRKPEPGEKVTYITSTNFIQRFGTGGLRLSAVKVGLAFKELGFKGVKRNRTTFWEVVERSTQDIQDELPTEDNSGNHGGKGSGEEQDDELPF